LITLSKVFVATSSGLYQPCAEPFRKLMTREIKTTHGASRRLTDVASLYFTTPVSYFSRPRTLDCPLRVKYILAKNERNGKQKAIGLSS
jgi:hypothetical protein